MKNSTLILLGLVGIGVYLYMRKRNANSTFYPTAPNPVAPVNYTGAPNVDSSGMEIPQTLDAKAQADVLNVRFAMNGFRKKLGQIPNTI